MVIILAMLVEVIFINFEEVELQDPIKKVKKKIGLLNTYLISFHLAPPNRVNEEVKSR